MVLRLAADYLKLKIVIYLPRNQFVLADDVRV